MYGATPPLALAVKSELEPTQIDVGLALADRVGGAKSSIVTLPTTVQAVELASVTVTV